LNKKQTKKINIFSITRTIRKKAKKKEKEANQTKQKNQKAKVMHPII
jgi:hypothetical protein